MSTKERIQEYNSIYHFIEHPDKYNFETNPERIIIRNSALRKQNSELYASYLSKNFPASLEREMQQFNKSLTETNQITLQDARAFFTKHGVAIVQSDIDPSEDDAIFVAKIFSKSDASSLVNRSIKEPLLQYITIDMISDRPKVWIDASELRSIYQADDLI